MRCGPRRLSPRGKGRISDKEWETGFPIFAVLRFLPLSRGFHQTLRPFQPEIFLRVPLIPAASDGQSILAPEGYPCYKISEFYE